MASWLGFKIEYLIFILPRPFDQPATRFALITGSKDVHQINKGSFGEWKKNLVKKKTPMKIRTGFVDCIEYKLEKWNHVRCNTAIALGRKSLYGHKEQPNILASRNLWKPMFNNIASLLYDAQKWKLNYYDGEWDFHFFFSPGWVLSHFWKQGESETLFDPHPL